MITLPLQLHTKPQDFNTICQQADIPHPCLKLYLWSMLFSSKPPFTPRMSRVGGRNGTQLPPLWLEQNPLVIAVEDKAKEVRPFVQIVVQNKKAEYHYVLRDAWRTAVTNKLTATDSMGAVTALVLTMTT
jgi:hypothetical protein